MMNLTMVKEIVGYQTHVLLKMYLLGKIEN